MPRIPVISHAARRRVARTAAKAFTSFLDSLLEDAAEALEEVVDEGVKRVEKARQRLPATKRRLKATRKS